MSGYKKQIISIHEKEELFEKLLSKTNFERKADISGSCIHFYTNYKDWLDQWDINWYFISEEIRSHGKIVALKGTGKKPVVKYDPISRTVFFFDCDYYGWIKSSALALTGDVLEDNHSIFSVHGALLDINGKGISIIGPTGTGKTTLSYGLLRHKEAKLVSDDWYFFHFENSDAVAYASEKNTYIRADVAKVWPEFKNMLKGVTLDNKGRAVVDVGRIIGKGKTLKTTDINTIILLQRQKGKEVMKKLKPEEAMKYMEKNNYCNPHILQTNKWKKKVRKKSFLKLFQHCNVYLLNTIETPGQSLERILDVLGADAIGIDWAY
jgi:hypothetical protein